MPTRQCLKGKSVACNLSKEINEILAKEATKKSPCNVNCTNDCQLKSCSNWLRYVSRLCSLNVIEDPVTVPTSKSATVRFIIRYVLGLRK